MRKITSWMVCFAILLSALAPAISQAVAPQKSAAPLWTEICTAAGLVFVDATHPAPDGSPSQQQSPHFDKCPYCRLQADAPGLPPSFDATPLLIVEAGNTHPFLFYESHRPLFARTSGHPRAPPVFL